MDFAKTPVKTSNGVYGAHFWLGGNSRDEEHSAETRACDVQFPKRVHPPKQWLRDGFPAQSGTFLAHGFEEQTVAMVPTKGGA